MLYNYTSELKLSVRPRGISTNNYVLYLKKAGLGKGCGKVTVIVVCMRVTICNDQLGRASELLHKLHIGDSFHSSCGK